MSAIVPSFADLEQRRAARPRMEASGRLYVADDVCVASWGAILRVEVYGLIADRKNGDLTGSPPRQVFIGHLSLKKRDTSEAIRLTQHGCGDGSRVAMDRTSRRTMREWARQLWAAA